MAINGGIERKGKQELALINEDRVLQLRKRGYSFAQISRDLELGDGEVYLLHRRALQRAAKRREEDHPIFLEQTIQGFEQLEEMILARGRINIETKLRMATLHLAAAREAGTKTPVNGRTAAEWEIELDRLEKINDETLGMENEDIDRLTKLRDTKAKFLGVEPARKVEVEHTLVLQATEAQARLREKLGLRPELVEQPKEVMPLIVDVQPEIDEVMGSSANQEVSEDLSA